MQSAAPSLKALRERTDPKLTVRAIADRLGMPLSSYARYEDPDRYKKPFLPMAMARSLARILADYGIGQDEVMQLAGIDDDRSPVLTEGEEAWLMVWRALTPGQRRLAMDQLCCSLGWLKPEGEPDVSCVFKHAA